MEFHPRTEPVQDRVRRGTDHGLAGGAAVRGARKAKWGLAFTLRLLCSRRQLLCPVYKRLWPTIRQIIATVASAEIVRLMCDHSAYRAFRAGVLAEIDAEYSGERKPNRDRADRRSRKSFRPAAQHPIAAARARIRMFRERVANHEAFSVGGDPDLEMLVGSERGHFLDEADWAPLNRNQEAQLRRALGIPSDVPLSAAAWSRSVRVARFLIRFFRPRWNLRAACRIMRRIRTLEGREYAFRNLVCPSLLGGLRYLDESGDFCLRRLNGFTDMKQYDALVRVPAAMLRAGYRLGMRTAGDMLGRLDGLPYSCAEIVWALVDQQVLATADDLRWLPQHLRRDRDAYGRDLNREESQRVGRTVRELVDAGAVPALALTVLKHPYQCNPLRLREVVTFLQSHGINDIGAVYAEVWQNLWINELDQWRFLVEVVGARAPGEFARFERLLHSSHKPWPEMISVLRGLGAGLDDLAMCQDLLIDAAHFETPPVGALTLLAGEPFGLPIADLAHCRRYLKDGPIDQLGAYLSVLRENGFGDPASILTFQSLYAQVHATTMSKLLAVAGARRLADSTERIADWVRAATQPSAYYVDNRNYGVVLESLEYLAAAIDLPNLDALNAALTLCELDPSLLRFLVEIKKLATLKALRTWYYEDGWGARTFRGLWLQVEETERKKAELILFESAFERRDFTSLDGNSQCVRDVVRQCAAERVGIKPEEGSPREWIDACTAIESDIFRQIPPALGAVLEKTDGIVLRSLLKALVADDPNYARLLNELAPVMESLLCGAGPSEGDLTPLQADAIGFVYRISPDIIKNRWKDVVGCERHLKRLRLRAAYPMRWHRTTMVASAPLDHRGLGGLREAAAFARRFRHTEFKDIFTACKHLRPGQIEERSADVWSLRNHLGVLLAAAERNREVSEWVATLLGTPARAGVEPLGSYRQTLGLADFFAVTLYDGIQSYKENFVTRFSEDDAELLATRLGLDGRDGRALQGRNALRVALEKTTVKVLGVYSKWAKKEVRKFQPLKEEQFDSSHITAVVSKHPAAFFARDATKLCTAENVAMWHEERHAHLLAFDAKGKRLVGMAMLYLQSVPALAMERKSLIVRAINPTDEAMAMHDPQSIVDAYFEVCRQIAVDNDLACVAFPPSAGQHFVSNRGEIEQAVTDRLRKQGGHTSKHPIEVVHATQGGRIRSEPESPQALFDAYEVGKGSVDTLYVVWRAPESVS